jgi:hypothetical protein
MARHFQWSAAKLTMAAIIDPNAENAAATTLQNM